MEMFFNLQDGTRLENDVSCVNQELANNWCLIEVGIILTKNTREAIYYRIKPSNMSDEFYIDWKSLINKGRTIYTAKCYKPAPDVEFIEETNDTNRIEILQTYGNVLLIKLDSNSRSNPDIYSFGRKRT